MGGAADVVGSNRQPPLPLPSTAYDIVSVQVAFFGLRGLPAVTFVPVSFVMLPHTAYITL